MTSSPLRPPLTFPFRRENVAGSADAEVLDIAQATVFNIPAGSTGTEQHLAMTVGSDTQYLCSGLWATNGKGDYMSATETGSWCVHLHLHLATRVEYVPADRQYGLFHSMRYDPNH